MSCLGVERLIINVMFGSVGFGGGSGSAIFAVIGCAVSVAAGLGADGGSGCSFFGHFGLAVRLFFLGACVFCVVVGIVPFVDRRFGSFLEDGVMVFRFVLVLGLLLVVFCARGCCQGVVADDAAVRVVLGNVCGSGSIAGFDGEAGYVVTNAHVVGTSVGREASVDCVLGGGRRTLKGIVIWAGFSAERLLDAAVVRVPGLSCKRARPMRVQGAASGDLGSIGSPRCVWPLVRSRFDSPVVSEDSPLLRGSPDAIGGQSGSSIFDADGVGFGLLTWSWGGRSAGQQTSWLWRLGDASAFLLVPARPPGLVEVGGRMPTEDGIFALASVSLRDLPIWLVSVPPPPPPGCHVLTEGEWAIVQLIRQQGSDVSVDWARVIRLVLELLSLFARQ